MLVSSFLKVGKENALSIEYLKEMTGLEGREVQRLIANERLNGLPILSTPAGGYFMPGSEWEVQTFVNSMRHRAGEIIEVADAVEKTHKQWMEENRNAQ